MRPQEARLAEARHFDAAHARLAFSPEEAKGRKRWRVVPLTPAAAEIVARNAQAHPVGPLLRNTDGNPWKRYAVNCRFHRLRAKLGLDVCPYQLRHRYCQRLLEAGLDNVTVGGLMGPADASMVSKVYSSMDRAGDYLQAGRGDGGEARRLKREVPEARPVGLGLPGCRRGRGRRGWSAGRPGPPTRAPPGWGWR